MKDAPWGSLHNKWLIVRPGVVLTEQIDAVIVALDPEFQAASLTAYVTSGLRSAWQQLALVKKFSALKGVDHEFPEIQNATLYSLIDYQGEQVYSWQPAWSRLLNLGLIINPPIRAVCLLDYWRGGINKRGMAISRSPHASGRSFDVGGGNDGAEGEYLVLAQAKPKIGAIRSVLLERENNAVHVDC